MTDDRIAIRYYEFWDIPRAFAFAFDGDTYVFDCRFDESVGDYKTWFDVLRVDQFVLSDHAEMSWQDLRSRGRQFAQIPVSSVVFDKTRRAFVSRTVLDMLA
ncbi:MAG: hypothetical protein HYX32_13960 [Actinobacteria bacterium]|nr:hypothetical protein [Actinomycetota bacterium]